MVSAAIKTALVIPVHNRRETTLRALRSLSRINTSGLDVRIFVVDDGSTDGTSEAVRTDYPQVELLKGDGTLHYAAGTNRGITAAITWEADFIVTMNDDSVFHEDFLISLVKTSMLNDDAIVGSLLLLWDSPHRVFQVDPEWVTGKGGWVFPQYLTAFTVPDNPFEVECVVGNCVLFPSAAIRHHGMMDERNFPHGWGDVQFTTRLRKAGWKLMIDPRSRVWCEPNTYPKPLHQLAPMERVRILIKDRRNPANLHRQFTALWHSAPSKASSLAAFTSYLFSLLFKALRLRPYERRS